MSKFFQPLILGTVSSILVSSVVFAQGSNQVPSIGGTWKMSIVGKNELATCTLIQKGNALTGTFRGDGRTLPLTGTVTNDNKVAFTGKSFFGSLKFSGTVEGKTMKGIVDLPLGRGRKNWTATQ
jgi:hypothetical protein